MYRPSLSVHTLASLSDYASNFPKTAALAVLLLLFSSQALASPADASILSHGYLHSDRGCQGYFDICCRLASARRSVLDESISPALPSEIYASQIPLSSWTTDILGNVVKLIRPALMSAAEAWCSLGKPDHHHPHCKATSSWPGFAGLSNIFSFGDSYTTTNFNYLGPQPTVDTPMGNPAWPGLTSAYPAANWIDFLTVEYNQSSLLTYNLAVGGAAVDSPFRPELMLSLKDQIHQRLLPGYHPKVGTVPLSRPWYGNDTLLAIWIGINDVNSSYMQGRNVTRVLNKQIMAAYRGLLQLLFTEMGFRNFLLINVPAIDRSALTISLGEEAQRIQKADIADFNGLIWEMAHNFKKEDARKGNIWVYDAERDFNRVLDDPTSFPQTSLLKNLTEKCDAYGPV